MGHGPGAVVLAPVLAFLSAVVTLIMISLLKELSVPAVLAFAAAGIAGWLLVRKRRMPWFGPGSTFTAPEIGSSAEIAKPIAGNVMPVPASASRHRGRAAQ
jgi:hypothetical protein